MPVREQSGKARNEPVRVVRHGETLYSIAWETGNDPEKLAEWNKINEANRIQAGQKIRLSPPSSAPAKSQKIPTIAKTDLPDQQKFDKSIQWNWPAKGDSFKEFDPKSGRKGLEILGQRGQNIVSAARGQVVYAGNGLRGYGRLLIVKHNNEYLSAYAHNKTLLVSEGEWVKQGQKVAEMGNSGTDIIKLHFEIRKNGDPVNPRRYLPKNG